MSVKPIPEGYGSVTPFLVVEDADQLISFLRAAFGAQERFRVTSESGNIGHAEVQIGDSVVMLFDRAAAQEGILQPGTDGTYLPSPSFLRLYVEDCDAVYQRALEAGATSVTPLGDFFGERIGRVRDPGGNVWWIQTHVEDINPEEMVKLTKGWMHEQEF